VITSCEIWNYRSIGEQVELSLGPLTALVGPNGSGKSNIVDALRFLAEALRIGLEATITKRQGISALRRWSGGRPFDITLRVRINYQRKWAGAYVMELGSVRDGYRVKREEGRPGCTAFTLRLPRPGLEAEPGLDHDAQPRLARPPESRRGSRGRAV